MTTTSSYVVALACTLGLTSAAHAQGGFPAGDGGTGFAPIITTPRSRPEAAPVTRGPELRARKVVRQRKRR